MEKHKAALIGCGRIGFILEDDPLRNKPCTHYGGASAAGIKITSACDINPERLFRFSEKAGIAEERCYTDYKTLFKNEKPELVIIATWTGSHSDIAVEAIKSGARAVVLEKPVAPSLKLARLITETAANHNCTVFINHERRFDSRYIKVRDLIQKGEIGKVLTVNARILTGRYRGKSHISEGGGPLLHDGTHLVDIVRYFFGDIISVKGNFERFERSSGFEDYAAAWLKTESGINIFLEAGGGRKYFLFEVEIWGTEGKIIIGNGYNRLYSSKKSEFYSGFRDIEEREFPHFKKNNCFTELYKNVKKSLDGKNFINSSISEDGYKALEIVHAVYLSSSKNGKEISIPVSENSVNLKKIFNLD